MSSVRQKRYEDIFRPGGFAPPDPHRRRSRGPFAPLRSGGARLWRAPGHHSIGLARQRAHLVEVAVPVTGRGRRSPRTVRAGVATPGSRAGCRSSSRSSRPSFSCRSRSRPRRARDRSPVAARSRASSSIRSCVWLRMNPAGTRKILCVASSVQSNVEINGFFLSSRAITWRCPRRSPASPRRGSSRRLASRRRARGPESPAALPSPLRSPVGRIRA